LGDLAIISDGAVAAVDGVIVAVGPTAQVRDEVTPGPGGEVIDAGGRAVVPGFVDPHTHLIFAGSRAEEFEMRLGGATYQQISRNSATSFVRPARSPRSSPAPSWRPDSGRG